MTSGGVEGFFHGSRVKYIGLDVAYRRYRGVPCGCPIIDDQYVLESYDSPVKGLLGRFLG